MVDKLLAEDGEWFTTPKKGDGKKKVDDRDGEKKPVRELPELMNEDEDCLVCLWS